MEQKLAPKGRIRATRTLITYEDAKPHQFSYNAVGQMKRGDRATHRGPKQLALALGLLLALPVRLAAEAPQYSTRLWQREDGLPHTVVQAIAQTRDGYLWAGTREGLARFDGVQFHTIDLGTGLVQPSIVCLLEDQQGNLWIGTEGAGLFRLHDGKLKRFGAAEGLASEVVFSLQQTTDGRLWVGTIRGLAQLVEGRFGYPFAREVRGGISSLFADKGGRLWIASPALSCLKDREVTTYTSQGLPSTVKCVYSDGNGVLWCGNSDGLFCVQEGRATQYKKGGGPAGIVSVLYGDREGNLWVGTYGGLSRFVGGEFIVENRGDAGSCRVFSITEDREGNVWAGSEEGIMRLTPRHFITYTKDHGLTENSIASVCADRQGGAWVAAWGGGVNQLEAGRVKTVLCKTNGLSTDFVLSVLEARDGSLWIGCDYGFGLNHLNGGANIHYGRAEGFAEPVVTALLEDATGSIWIGSRDALSCFRDGKFSRFTTRHGLAHNKINALCEGDGGVVWVGTEGGLTICTNGVFFDLSTRNPRLKTVVLSLYEDPERVLWIGTRQSGLLRFRDGQIDAFASPQGLFSDCIYGIVEDGRANLWFNSSKGFFRVSKQQLDQVARGAAPAVVSAVYGRADGILSSSQYREATQPAASKGPDGRIWFRSTQGVVVVDPAQIRVNEVPPPVKIEEILSDKRPLNQAIRAYGESDLKLPPSRGELEIHYTALSFRAPEKVRFRYKLEGMDPNWVDASNRRVAYYNNLRPDSYTFQVIACNEDGVWSERGAVVRLTLEPHFWETWWFLGAGGFLAVGAIAGSVRYATWRRMQRKLERLEHQHAIEQERARIARDLHDNLGARLTEILMLNDAAIRANANPEAGDQSQSRISMQVRELAENLDAIVWATNPKNDSLNHFVAYLFEYLDGLAQASPVRILRDVPSGLSDCSLSSAQRHNLFLVIKEALHNVFKHAQASEVRFRLRLDKGSLSMSVEDNGRGFVPEATSELGNGLLNMEKRMQLIGGSFSMASKPGAGTRIRLETPVRSPGKNGV